MNIKAIIGIALVAFILLAFGFSRWKKKSRHTYTLKTGGNPAPKTGRGRHEAGYFNLPKQDRQSATGIPQTGQATSTADKVANASRSGVKGKAK